jgi:hypothetical protein
MNVIHVSLSHDPRGRTQILRLECHCPGDDILSFLIPLLGNPYLKKGNIWENSLERLYKMDGSLTFVIDPLSKRTYMNLVFGMPLSW